MTLTRRTFIAAGVAALAAAAITPGRNAGASPAREPVPATLRVGLIPNQAPDRIRAQYAPFGEYLSATLGQPVELFVATDYAGVVEAMASDRLDLAYFGGLTYIQAEKRLDLRPIVTEIDRETGTTQYYSALITHVDSDIQAAADIAGRKFAFGDINSTSGSLYPRIMLDMAGIGDFTNPNLFIYSGGHDATTLAVVNRTVDAGGVEKRIMQRLIDGGQADGSQIRIVQETLVQGYPWCIRSALDPEFAERVTQAFEAISDESLLKLMRAQSYARVGPADYDEARSEAHRVGLVR